MIITMVTAALVAAAPQSQPASAPQHQGHTQQMQHKPTDGRGEQKDMDCCGCCKDMAKQEVGPGPQGVHTHK